MTNTVSKETNQKILDIITGKTKHPLYEKLFEKYPKGSGKNASPEKLEEMRDAIFNVFESIEKEDTIKDVVIVEVSGGVVQSVSSTKQIKVLVLDADTDDGNSVYNKIVNGNVYCVTEHNLGSDQDYCNNILEQINK